MLNRAGLGGLVLVVLATLAGEAAWADPLRGGGAPAPITEGWVPEVMQPLVGWLAGMQRRLVGGLRADLAAARHGFALAPMLALIGGAFLYGVLHAAGPGHGKIVVGSYVLGSGARWRDTLAMSGLTALVQSLSAIILVGGFTLLVEQGGRRVAEEARLLELFSAALIAALGLMMLKRAVRGEGCGHDHGPAPHHGHGQGCDHGHEHGHAHPAAPKADAGRKEMLLAAAAVGIRPCTGAILVLLFTFSNGMAGLGIAAVLAMGVGTALTVAGVGLGTLGLRAGLGAGVTGFVGPAAGRWMGRGLGISAALAVTLLGLAMLAASASGA